MYINNSVLYFEQGMKLNSNLENAMLRITSHFERRIAQRGISRAMVKWTIDNGEIRGDKFITTRKMLRSTISSMNARIIKLSRLKAKFNHLNVARLIDKARTRLVAQKSIALKLLAKGGVTVVVDNAALITAYDADSYKKY